MIALKSVFQDLTTDLYFFAISQMSERKQIRYFIIFPQGPCIENIFDYGD